MRAVNPAFIPRNHRVEAALSAASKDGDYRPFRKLLGILQHPYEDQPESAEYGLPPQPSQHVFRLSAEPEKNSVCRFDSR